MTNATVFLVGPNKPFPSPNKLYKAGVVEGGDTIYIDAAIYSGEETLAKWSANNLLIKGVGGIPMLIADGEYINGKGIWILSGNNITVEHIHFEGAAVPDKNGAGIRLDGIGMVVKNCYFINNENGILTSNPHDGDIIIENCEFNQGGHGDGFSHNLYIGRVNSLTFRFNYSHHAKIGHLLKSRAKTNYIAYNIIMDEETGFSSRLIDIPNGGTAIIKGNILMQGLNAVNSTIVGYGLEGLTDSIDHSIWFISNTCLNERRNSGIFIDLEDGISGAYLINNVFTGDGVIYRGEVTELHHNIRVINADSAGFADYDNYDYKLVALSPAVDYGVAVDSMLYPQFDPSGEKRMITGDAIDAGAYEYNHGLYTSSLFNSTFKVWPNPGEDEISVNAEGVDVEKILMIDITGREVIKSDKLDLINTSSLAPGFYKVLIISVNGNKATVSWIKR